MCSGSNLHHVSLHNSRLPRFGPLTIHWFGPEKKQDKNHYRQLWTSTDTNPYFQKRQTQRKIRYVTTIREKKKREERVGGRVGGGWGGVLFRTKICLTGHKDTLPFMIKAFHPDKTVQFIFNFVNCHNCYAQNSSSHRRNSVHQQVSKLVFYVWLYLGECNNKKRRRK